MSSLVVMFNNIEQFEKDNSYEPGVIKTWVEDGDWSAIGEVFDICKAYNIELKEDK